MGKVRAAARSPASTCPPRISAGASTCPLGVLHWRRLVTPRKAPSKTRPRSPIRPETGMHRRQYLWPVCQSSCRPSRRPCLAEWRDSYSRRERGGGKYSDFSRHCAGVAWDAGDCSSSRRCERRFVFLSGVVTVEPFEPGLALIVQILQRLGVRLRENQGRSPIAVRSLLLLFE